MAESNFIIKLIAFLLSCGVSDAVSSDCFIVRGTTICSESDKIAVNVNVSLWNKDLNTSKHNLLGYTKSGLNGNFTVQGCIENNATKDLYLKFIFTCGGNVSETIYHGNKSDRIYRLPRPSSTSFYTLAKQSTKRLKSSSADPIVYIADANKGNVTVDLQEFTKMVNQNCLLPTATTATGNNFSYVFYAGPGLVKCLTDDGESCSGLMSISDTFTPLSPSLVNAAVTDVNGTTYLFYGNQTWGYTWNQSSKHFEPMKSDYPKHISFEPTAAFLWNKKIILTNGSQYREYCPAENEVHNVTNEEIKFLNESILPKVTAVMRIRKTSKLLVQDGVQMSTYDLQKKQHNKIAIDIERYYYCGYNTKQ